MNDVAENSSIIAVFGLMINTNFQTTIRPIMPEQSQPSALITLFENTAIIGSAAPAGLRDRLCAALRQAINTGALAGGERLPSSRILASDLKLSRITVEAAYAQVEAAGYLQSQTAIGTSVSRSLPRALPLPNRNIVTS